MKFTMTKIAAAAVLAVASTGALAVPVAWTGGFDMYDPDGYQMDANGLGTPGLTSYTTGVIDEAAGTFTLASTYKFNSFLWTADSGTLYGAGTHTVNVNGDGQDGAGAGNVTFTVGAGQIGGNVNFNWNGSNGIDVFQVWDVTTNVDGSKTFASTDFDILYNGVAVPGDAILGVGMVDGPFTSFNANFNMATAPVPEASTYGMMLAGLGLVGFAVRRRKLVA